MDERISAAIEVLTEQLAGHEKRAAETKRTINSLLQSVGEPPAYDDVDTLSTSLNMRRDEFYGKAFATAAQMYLQRRKQACTSDEIMKGLEQGGFDFRVTEWKEKDRLRSLAISLAKNNKVFHKLPNGTFGLAAWYENVVKREEDSPSKGGEQS
jgi:hypothetical protein